MQNCSGHEGVHSIVGIVHISRVQLLYLLYTHHHGVVDLFRGEGQISDGNASHSHSLKIINLDWLWLFHIVGTVHGLGVHHLHRFWPVNQIVEVVFAVACSHS